MNKQSFIGVIVSLVLLISSMELTQNKKELVQKRDNPSEFIIQRDTSLIADSSKQSFGQQSIIFLTNNDKRHQVNQLNLNNNVIVYFKTAMDSTTADTVNASQTGEDNRIYLITCRANTARSVRLERGTRFFLSKNLIRRKLRNQKQRSGNPEMAIVP
jgi:hypothetical protein